MIFVSLVSAFRSQAVIANGKIIRAAAVNMAEGQVFIILSLVAATMVTEQLADAAGRSLADIASQFDKAHLIR